MRKWTRLPRLHILRFYMLLIGAFPIDTGNMRYNATKIEDKDNGHRIYIDKDDAYYSKYVFGYYMDKRGINFLYEGAVKGADYLRTFLNQGRVNKDYYKARRSVYGSSKNNVRREMVNKRSRDR